MELNREIPELILRPEDYAAIYARKSIKAENNSIQSQLALARDTLVKNDLLLYKEYWDEESATKLPPNKRQGFSELIKDAKAGKFKTVIVFRRDRLARKASDLLEIRNLFKKLHVRIIYSNSGEYQPSESYMSDFIENIIMAVDELEPQIVAERTKAGRIKKRERREYFCANLPFGFTREIEDNKSYYPCDGSKQGILQYIFDKYRSVDENYKLTDLVREVNQMEGGEPSITVSKVNSIIKNPIYAGYQFKDSKKKLPDLFTQSDDGHFDFNPELLQKCSNVTPVVSFELWCECIKKWREHYRFVPKSAAQNYLFKGMLFCGKCKKAMSLIYEQYKCRTARCTTFNYLYLQKEVIKVLVDDIITNGGFGDFVDNKILSVRHEIKQLNKELKHIKAKLENHTLGFIKNYKSEGASNSEKNYILRYLKQESRIKEQINKLEDKVFKLTQIRSGILSISNSGLSKHLLSNKEKTQTILFSLIEKVIVYGKKEELSIQII